mmetsp:Transcript_113180/g.325426  ORF Transcript_113180/g.325426 Transcript_113180/m.325426 type:complete len:217 (-) Transcript_113180:154-804(-)
MPAHQLFRLLLRVTNPVLYFVEEARTLHIRQPDRHLGRDTLQEASDPCNRAAGASAHHEGVQAAPGLLPQLGAGAEEMRIEIRGILKLVRKYGCASAMGRAKLESPTPGNINIVRGIRNTRRPHKLNLGTETFQNPHLFLGLVIGHNNVHLVAACCRSKAQRNPSAAGCSFADCAADLQLSRSLCLLNYPVCDAVFLTSAGAEELGFGNDATACCV